MHAPHAAFGALALSAGLAAGAIHIEVAAMSAGPDGFNTFGAVIGQPDMLGVWIWADEPGVGVRSVSFDILGAAFINPAPGSPDYVFDGAGVADPNSYYAVSFDGVASDPTLIEGVSMSQIPVIDPPVVLPSAPGSALLIYTGLTGTAWSFSGGALPVNALVIADDGVALDDVRVHGWYQIPSPASLALLAMAAVPRRRRPATAPRA